jgi:hypothetical protein
MRIHQIVHPVSKMNNNFDKALDQEHFGDLLFYRELLKFNEILVR